MDPVLPPIPQRRRMNFDFQKLFDSKTAHRRKLAALPIVEKLRLLDAMRERAIACSGASVMAGRRHSDSSIVREDPPSADRKTLETAPIHISIKYPTATEILSKANDSAASRKSEPS